jgi:hypothetical protein
MNEKQGAGLKPPAPGLKLACAIAVLRVGSMKNEGLTIRGLT